jgi:hypothetical protein
MKTKIYLFVLICLLTFPAFASAQKQSEKSRAVEVVKKFYRMHFGRDSEVTEKHLGQMREFLSPDLYESYRVKLNERNEYVKQNPNTKTMFEQFGFEYVREACDYAYKIGKGTARRDEATVTVYLYNSKKCQYDGGALQATYKIDLIKLNDRWLIDGFSH